MWCRWLKKVVRLIPSPLERRLKETDGPMSVMKKYMGIGNDHAEEGDKTE